MTPPSPARRDGVDALDGTPAIVSLSDVHGYLADARSALTTLGDHPDHDPVVEADADGRLHWAGNDYVLVLNGDLVDRGPDSRGCVDLAFRLQDEAPAGRVRYHLGNHESFLLFPALRRQSEWAASGASDATRRGFLERVADGDVTMAYAGHAYDYSHAGGPDGVDPARLNDRLADAGADLRAALGASDEADRQRDVYEAYDDLFGAGSGRGRGPDAGPLWLDFAHLPADAPPQVVGHTMHVEPTRTGTVVCENVIRRNVDRAGGEAVLVETSDDLVVLVRGGDGGVEERVL